MSQLRQKVIEIVRERGLTRLAEPVQLASGEFSRDFVDGKAALARGEDLRLACEALIELAAARQVTFDAVGGLTLGADQFAHVVAVLAPSEWFVVRKASKGRGTNRLVEGASLHPGKRALLVDDVVTTGGSIQQAYAAIRETGAEIAGAITLVDRGETASRFFADAGVPYAALITYSDLGIEPVGGRGLVSA